VSDPDPDPRPQPQYGEYATPEEQRARIRRPDATYALESGHPVVSAGAPGAAADASPAPSPAPRPRVVDRIVTVALLAYGLFNVLSSFAVFLDYGAYAEAMFAVMGVDAELADPAAGRPWGVAAAVLLSAGWIATALVSWWSMRRGRITWWIPLVAGIVFTFTAGVLMVIPLMNDPAAWGALVGSLR
jgi:hypothetical protein